MRRFSPLPLVLALLGPSCENEPEPVAAPGSIVRDSNGIAIVENGDPAGVPAWRLEPLPIASIGDGMGDPLLELHDVTGVVLLDDGSVVIANSGSHEIRTYSPDGRPGPAVGKAGEGPGEFMGEIQLARMPGDSILAYDWTLRRGTVIDRHGAVARTIDFRHLNPNVDLRGVMADGSILLSMRHLDLTEGLNADSVVFVRTDSRGVPIDWPGWARLSRVVLRFFEGPPVVDDLPFGPQGHAAAFGNAVAVVDGANPQYVLRGDAGAPVSIVRWTTHQIAVTQGTIDSFMEWDASVERSYIAPATRTRWLETIEFPAVAPATASLAVDPTGRILIEEWRPPWAPGDAPWLVFAADGHLVARLTVPRGLDVRAASGDLIAGLERDALDVEHVRVYRVDVGG